MTITYLADTGTQGGVAHQIAPSIIKQATLKGAPLDDLDTIRLGCASFQRSYTARRLDIRIHLVDPISTAPGENTQQISVAGTLYAVVDCFAQTGQVAAEVVVDIVVDHPGGPLVVGFASSTGATGGTPGNPPDAGRTTPASVVVWPGDLLSVSQPVTAANPPATKVLSTVELIEGEGSGNAIHFTLDGSIDFWGRQSNGWKSPPVTDPTLRVVPLTDLIVGVADALVVWPRGGGAPFTYPFTYVAATGTGEQTLAGPDDFERTSIAPWTANGIGPGNSAGIVGTAGAKKLRLTTGSQAATDCLEYARLDNNGASWPADSGIEFEFDISTLGVVGPSFWLRDFGDYVAGGHGGFYAGLDIAGNALSLNTRDGIPTMAQPHGTYANIDSTPFTWAVAHYFCRYEAEGNAIRLYVGLTAYIAGVTPWTLTAVDSAHVVPNPGAIAFFAGDHGANLGGYHVDFDKVRVYSLPTATPPGGGGGTGTWNVVASGTHSNGSGTAVGYPSLTGSGAGGPQGYYGYCTTPGSCLTGTAGGFLQTLLPISGDAIIGGPVAAGATVTPGGTLAGASTSTTVGVIVQAPSGTAVAFATLGTDNSNGLASITIAPTAIGNLVLATVTVFAGSPTVTGLTGGGCTWSPVPGASGTAGAFDVYTFAGVVTATGAHPLTPTFSGAIGATGVEIVAVEARSTSGSVTPPTGKFSVVGSKIFDPSGNEFIPAGVSILAGDHADWQRGFAPGFSQHVKDWGMNCSRLCAAIDTGNPTALNQDPLNPLTDRIDEWTAAGLVAIVNLHWPPTSQFMDAGMLAAANTWITTLLNHVGANGIAYKNNPYVWLDLGNEPGSEGFPSERPADSYWLTEFTSLVANVRSISANTIVICTGCSWGQEAGDWSSNLIPSNHSAIITYGPTLVANYGQVAFAFHCYDQWVFGDARMADYFDRVHAAGLVLLMGEGGDLGYDGAHTVDSVASMQSFFRLARPRGVGVFGLWHGQGKGFSDISGEGYSLVQGTSGGYISFINSLTNPTNLTVEGQLMWDFCAPNRH